MSRRLVVVRPQPGNARTVAAARALGWTVDAMPLFAAVPLAWEPPDPAAYDALLLTSANAVRHGGSGIRAMGLPVAAVGAATAAAAREAGLDVALTGDGDGAALVALARADGWRRLLHLAGRKRTELGVAAIAVYASEALPAPADVAERLRDAIVLLHSARAAGRLAALARPRAATRLAAISPAALTAAGGGWAGGAVAEMPTDAALLAAAALLTAIDPADADADKRGRE